MKKILQPISNQLFFFFFLTMLLRAPATGSRVSGHVVLFEVQDLLE